MIDNPIHIVFSGGGTGGHLFPGLAVAEQLAHEAPRVRITFAGSGKEFERRHVAAAGFEYVALRCRPAPRRFSEAFSFFTDNVAGYRTAARFLRQQHVAAVVGLGGYASVPMAQAASRRGRPLVLLEQNAIPGRATRWLAGSATLVCAAMVETRSNLRCRCPVRVTGNPIRGGFGETNSSKPPHQLLILGGSSGARSINENVPRALCKVGSRLDGWKILHQSGEPDLEATRELYRKLHVRATVVSFVAEMQVVLGATELAVCRAGGTTLAELAAAGVPAVLLPYLHAADDHQRRNADVFTAAGGAITLDQRDLSDRLDNHPTDVLWELLGDSQQRARMSAAMRRLSRPDAAAEVADLILKVVSAQPRHVGVPLAA